MIKTTIYCLLIAIALRVAWAQTVKTIYDQPFVDNGDRALLIKGRVAGDMKVWLIVEAHNGAHWKSDGFDPSYTRIVTDYMPMFRKLPTGQWEIMLTSEIAKDLP